MKIRRYAGRKQTRVQRGMGMAIVSASLAPEPATAKQHDVPESAIASGGIALTSSPEEIAVAIVRIARAEAH